MSKMVLSHFRAAGALLAVLPLVRQSRAGDCQPFVDETVITEEPYAAISGVQVAQVGDTLTIRFKYQLYNPDGSEQARNQLFIAVEQSIVATVYDGSPGPCPGAVGGWSSASIAAVALPPGSHTVYAVHTAADSQAAGLDGYEREGIGWRVEIGVFAVPEIPSDEIPREDQTLPPEDEQVCPPSAGGDTDADGVCGHQDACSNSDVRPTIVIQECDCLAANRVVGAGCTMADEIAAIAVESRSTKDFALAVSRVATSWERAGLITKADREGIESCSENAFFPSDKPDEAGPPAPDPDERPRPPQPPAETDADKKTPSYQGDAQEGEQTGNDAGSGSAGQVDRVTGFESTSPVEPAPPIGCGFGLLPVGFFGLAFIAMRRPDRRSRTWIRRASFRTRVPSR